MANLTLILLLASATLLCLVACLPLGAYPSSGPPNTAYSSSSSHYFAKNPTLNPNPTSTYPHRYHWYRDNYRRTNTSESLPRLFYSGPWDRAWEVWSNVGDKLKLFKRNTTGKVIQHKHHLKRGVTNFRVQQAIANHLRPTTWWQKFKDFFSRITRRQIHVTKAQADKVREKYRSGHYAYRFEERTRSRAKPFSPNRP